MKAKKLFGNVKKTTLWELIERSNSTLKRFWGIPKAGRKPGAGPALRDTIRQCV